MIHKRFLDSIQVEDLKKVLSVNESYDIDVIRPFFMEAYLFVKDFLDKELDQIVPRYEDKSITTEQSYTRELILYPLLKYVLYKSELQASVQRSGLGISLIKTENVIPVELKRLEIMRNEHLIAAYNGLNMLLEHLGKKPPLFIQDAVELQEYVNCERNHYLFYKMIPDLKYIQRYYLESLMGSALYQKFVTEFSLGTLNPLRKEAMNEYIKPFLAHKIWAISLPKFLLNVEMKLYVESLGISGNPAELGVPLSKTAMNITQIALDDSERKADFFIDSLNKFLYKNYRQLPDFENWEGFRKPNEIELINDPDNTYYSF